MNDLLAKETAGPCEEAVTKILAEFKISREVYFGGALIGPCCKRLLENSAKIFQRIRVVLKANKKEGVTDDFIDKTLRKYDALFQEFDVCCSIMRSIDMQTDDEIEAFRASSINFGRLWRSAFGIDPRVTPKLHLLESHVYQQLCRFGVLALFSEDPIERLHHQWKVASRRVCGIREYEKRERHLAKREAALNSPAVQEVVSSIAAKRKRKFKRVSSEKRAVKRAQVDAKLKIKIEKVDAFKALTKYAN